MVAMGACKTEIRNNPRSPRKSQKPEGHNKGKRFSSVEHLPTTLAAASLVLGVEPEARSSYFPLD